MTLYVNVRIVYELSRAAGTACDDMRRSSTAWANGFYSSGFCLSFLRDFIRFEPRIIRTPRVLAHDSHVTRSATVKPQDLRQDKEDPAAAPPVSQEIAAVKATLDMMQERLTKQP